MNDTLNDKILKDLTTEEHPLRQALVGYINRRGVDNLEWWYDWECDGNDYDVNVYHNLDEDNFGVIVYATWFDGKFLQTDSNKVVARTSLDKATWREIAGQALHNVELTVTLRLPVSQKAHCAERAVNDAINRFSRGEFDITQAFEHCTSKAVIIDDLPKNGDKCFTVNVLETRSKDIQVYAASANDAENLVRNHLHTHVALTADDTIGYDVLVQQ